MVDVTIEDGWATITPATPEVARRLLAVGPSSAVRTVSGGPHIALYVPEGVAEKAGLVHTPSGGRGAATGQMGGPDGAAEPPTRGASRAAWREFLDSQGVPYSEDDTRNGLIAIWEGQ